MNANGETQGLGARRKIRFRLLVIGIVLDKSVQEQFQICANSFKMISAESAPSDFSLKNVLLNCHIKSLDF